MARTVRVQIDDELEKLLAELKRRTGWTDSKLVREGIKVLAAMRLPRRREIIGLGRFASGIADLSTNPKRLSGFGE